MVTGINRTTTLSLTILDTLRKKIAQWRVRRNLRACSKDYNFHSCPASQEAGDTRPDKRMVSFSLSKPGANEAYLISWLSLALTGLAFVIGLAVATSSNSSATLGFALENAVDGISSALVLWRFWGGGHSIPVAELELREKRASVGIAIAFVVLAVTVGGTASAHISEHSVPGNVAALLGVSAPSVVVFTVLGAVKLHLGFATHSPSLKKDAACSLCGAP